MKSLLGLVLVGLLLMASMSMISAATTSVYSVVAKNGAGTIGGVALTSQNVDFSAWNTGTQGQGTLTMQGKATDKMSSVRVNFKQTSAVQVGNVVTVTAAYTGTQSVVGKVPYTIKGVLTYTYNVATKAVVVSGPGFGASFTSSTSI